MKIWTPERRCWQIRWGPAGMTAHWENLVLETYEKLQSHASPEAWLDRNRTAWTVCTGDFDETPYADAPSAAGAAGKCTTGPRVF